MECRGLSASLACLLSQGSLGLCKDLDRCFQTRAACHKLVGHSMASRTKPLSAFLFLLRLNNRKSCCFLTLFLFEAGFPPVTSTLFFLWRRVYQLPSWLWSRLLRDCRGYKLNTFVLFIQSEIVTLLRIFSDSNIRVTIHEPFCLVGPSFCLNFD